MGVEIVGTVVGGLIIAAILAFWPKISAHFKASWRQHDRNQAADKNSEHNVLLEQVEQIAKETNLRIALRSSGSRPTRVHFSDGSTHYYFSGDYPAYQRAMNDRKVPPTQSSPGNPPRTIRQWSDKDLRQWLDDNTT